MLVRDLLEATDPFSFGKDIQRKLKELAANNDLTFKSGMAWPRNNKSGSWVGGTFSPKGGRAAAEKRGDLDLNTHVVGALTDFADYLAELVADGMTIQVGSSSQVSNSESMEIGEGDSADDIFHVLKTLLHTSVPPNGKPYEEKGPTIIMFVRRPADLMGKVTVRFSAVLRSDNSSAQAELRKRGLPVRVEAEVGGVMDEADFKRLKKAHVKFNEAGYRPYPEKPMPALEKYRLKLAPLVLAAAGIKADPADYETAFFSIDEGTLSKNTVKTDITPIARAAVEALHL